MTKKNDRIREIIQGFTVDGPTSWILLRDWVEKIQEKLKTFHGAWNSQLTNVQIGWLLSENKNFERKYVNGTSYKRVYYRCYPERCKPTIEELRQIQLDFENIDLK